MRHSGKAHHCRVEGDHGFIRSAASCEAERGGGRRANAGDHERNGRAGAYQHNCRAGSLRPLGCIGGAGSDGASQRNGLPGAGRAIIACRYGHIIVVVEEGVSVARSQHGGAEERGGSSLGPAEHGLAAREARIGDFVQRGLGGKIGVNIAIGIAAIGIGRAEIDDVEFLVTHAGCSLKRAQRCLKGAMAMEGDTHMRFARPRDDSAGAEEHISVMEVPQMVGWSFAADVQGNPVTHGAIRT